MVKDLGIEKIAQVQQIVVSIKLKKEIKQPQTMGSWSLSFAKASILLKLAIQNE